jgi:hypothetical protein
VNSTSGERERLQALLAALADPPQAAALRSDDPTLVAVARHHRLTPLLSIICGSRLPPQLAEVCRRDHIVTAAHNIILGQVAEECLRALAAAGIPTIVLKGLDYEARLYRVLGARPTADVDLLVRNEHRRPAFAVLDQLGFEPRAAAPGFDEADYHEVAWTRAGVEVDLHMALAPLVRCRIDYLAIWRDAEPFRLGGSDGLALARPHAAVFHALHMAIDHFGVPAIYLVDLARLLPGPEQIGQAHELAHAWRCERPLITATALVSDFLPGHLSHLAGEAFSGRTRRVVESYGSETRLPRPEQLRRKLDHFDGPTDALRYLLVQGRRKLREQVERRIGGRSARQRLRMEG